MKTKQLHESWVHKNGHSTNASKIIKLTVGDIIRKYIFSYRNGNAFEYFTIEQYDGVKLNTIASMSDLGIQNNTSTYHLMSETDQKMRFEMLTKEGIEFIKLLN